MRTRTMSVSAARASFPRAIEAAERGDAIEITRHGRPVAVLVSPERLAARVPPETFASALVAFHERHAGQIDPTEDPFQDVRDRSPGRKAPW